MSLKVHQLNGDTTFLLTFSPPFAPEKLSKRFPGDYTILIDPWLRGYSSILHPTFQISRHTSTPAVDSIRDIPRDPDLIIISQDKPDHCHRATLCSLARDTAIKILATPSAARKIRSWKHFDASQIHVLKSYSAANSESVVRIPLPAYSSSSAAGEITIVNVPTKRDMTGLHNAIGITYQPPSTLFTLHAQSTRYPIGAKAVLSQSGISVVRSFPERPRTQAESTTPTKSNFLQPMKRAMSNPNLRRSFSNSSRPRSRADSAVARTQSPDINSERILSILYTPHGVSTRTLEPYIKSHLEPRNALPLSALFHSINTEENPWFMGGRVAAGACGGMQIIKSWGAKYWIGAHDEVKDNRGVATKWIKSRLYEVDEVEAMLEEVGVMDTTVTRLEVGETVNIAGPTDEHNAGLWTRQSMSDRPPVLDIPEPVPPLPQRYARELYATKTSG